MGGKHLQCEYTGQTNDSNLSRMKGDGARFHHTTQNGVPFKTWISGISFWTMSTVDKWNWVRGHNSIGIFRHYNVYCPKNT